MDDILRRTILTRHNSHRNVLALGGADDFKRPAAADMGTMVNESIILIVLIIQLNDKYSSINFVH